MTAGIYRNSDHPSLIEPWRERSEKNVLAMAEKRIRGRIQGSTAWPSARLMRGFAGGSAALPD